MWVTETQDGPGFSANTTQQQEHLSSSKNVEKVHLWIPKLIKSNRMEMSNKLFYSITTTWDLR